MNRSPSAPEFLSIGHVTLDRNGTGVVSPGGAALYASLTAIGLGKRAAIVTSYGPDFPGQEALKGIEARVVPARETSTFTNLYPEGRRVQYVSGVAEPLMPHSVPSGWRGAGIVYLCPVLHEVPMDMADLFPCSLLGIAPQGWLREWDEGGRIRGRRWEGFAPALRRANMVIVSEEDLACAPDLLLAMRREVPVVILTRSDRGAIVFLRGNRSLVLGAFRAEARDPTGAGDCFGAAFLIRYGETGDVEEAGRFASCVGSLVVEGKGPSSVPRRQDVMERLGRERIHLEWRGPRQVGAPRQPSRRLQ